MFAENNRYWTGAAWTHDAVEWLDLDGQQVHTAGGLVVTYHADLRACHRFDDAHADDAYHALIKDVENGYTRSAALVVPEGPGLALARLWIRADDGRAAERDGDRVRSCGDLAPVAEIAIWRADRPHH